MNDEDTKFFINPISLFVIMRLNGDSGLIRRKLVQIHSKWKKYKNYSSCFQFKIVGHYKSVKY